MQIMAARCNGVSFSQMDFDTAKPDIDKILLSGAAISGSPLPTTDFFANIISNEVYEFITGFGYANYTLHEILLSMRINAKGNMTLPTGDRILTIDFYGNCFNVNFLAKVLYTYSLLRGGLDRKLENYLDKLA